MHSGIVKLAAALTINVWSSSVNRLLYRYILVIAYVKIAYTKRNVYMYDQTLTIWNNRFNLSLRLYGIKYH